MRCVLLLFFLFAFVSFSSAQEKVFENKFQQIDPWLPTPNVYRTASGAPGPQYWQQRVDYKMDIELDDENQRIYGEEEITYYNNSPDPLNYLWVQLDQNVRAKDSDTYKIRGSSIGKGLSAKSIQDLEPWFEGGFNLEEVKDVRGNDLSYFVNKTMMRIDLPEILVPGAAFTFKIKWWYNINDRMRIGGRSGYEYFEEDSNYLYTIAQFYPRMAVYTDYAGWQNKQFLGSGEFTLSFGDFEVNITAPEDHVLSATGELQNQKEVLTPKQIQRLSEARNSTQPVLIITQEEAERNETLRASGKKTWRFKAKNVRDFAFASSRKFIWDAQGVKFGNRTVMAMSLYPKEGNPLWERYSTKAVVQTLETYSRMTFDYPYPVAISINADRIGMEYPMICFNFGRPEKDGTYPARTKYGMISVIIHEVGHNYFPMIVSSDERQWTWMDEGLNTFLQYLTEQEFERDYPSVRGEPSKIVDYMKGDPSGISPIMSNSELIKQFGNNAYGKPATALNILRETVMGRELFDFAFKTFSQRWMFKHPQPADFFRTMEDASAVDLDWFWNGWFFTTDHVDISLDEVNWYQLDSKNPEIEKGLRRERSESRRPTLSEQRNRESIESTYSERDSLLIDFYTNYDENQVDELDKKDYENYLKGLTEEEREILDSTLHFYELTFSNKGGLVMPLIIEFTFEDGTSEIKRIPAEIWSKNNEKVTKVFSTSRAVEKIVLDPFLETADTELNNNSWPRQTHPSRFELFKQQQRKSENPMQRMRKLENKE